MGVPLPVWGAPDTYRLSIRQAPLHSSPATLAEPCRAVRDVSFGGPIESLSPDRRVHSEALLEELVEVELAQRLWAPFPFPGEVSAVWPGRQRLLGDEPLQDGKELQRRLRQVLPPFGVDYLLFLLRRRPVLLASRKPRQRLRQDLIAIAAQPFDVDLVTDDGDDPITAIAGRVLQEFDVVGGEGETGSPRIGAHLVAVGATAVIDAAAQGCLLLFDVGFAPGRHLGAVRDDRSSD